MVSGRRGPAGTDALFSAGAVQGALRLAHRVKQVFCIGGRSPRKVLQILDFDLKGTERRIGFRAVPALEEDNSVSVRIFEYDRM
jgi:hypothetical protein